MGTAAEQCSGSLSHTKYSSCFKLGMREKVWVGGKDVRFGKDGKAEN